MGYASCHSFCFFLLDFFFATSAGLAMMLDATAQWVDLTSLDLSHASVTAVRRWAQPDRSVPPIGDTDEDDSDDDHALFTKAPPTPSPVDAPTYHCTPASDFSIF